MENDNKNYRYKHFKHTIFTASIVGGLGIDQVFNVVANKAYYAYIWVGLMPLTMRTEQLVT